MSTAQGGMAWWYYFTATPLYSLNWPTSQIKNYGSFHGAEVRALPRRGLKAFEAILCDWVTC